MDISRICAVTFGDAMGALFIGLILGAIITALVIHLIPGPKP